MDVATNSDIMNKYPITIGKKIDVDVNNNVIEIEVKDTCAGITIFPMFEGDFIEGNGFRDNTSVRVEMIRKNQPDVVLYDLSLKDLYITFVALGRSGAGITIPFAFKDNLVLGKDSYLKVVINYTPVAGGSNPFDIDGMRYFKNYVATSTNVPISVKRVKVTEDVEIDTEYFQYMIVSSSVYKLETVVNTAKTTLVSSSDSAKQAIVQNSFSGSGGIVSNDSVKTNTGNCCCDGNVERTKIEMTFDYLSYLGGLAVSAIGVGVLQTALNQKVKVYVNEDTEDEILLVQA